MRDSCDFDLRGIIALVQSLLYSNLVTLQIWPIRHSMQVILIAGCAISRAVGDRSSGSLAPGGMRT